MTKLKPLKTYIENLWMDIEDQRGERPRMLRHLVDKTAKDQRHIDDIDNILRRADFTSKTIGVMGQQKIGLNPLLTLRDKVSRTLLEDLKELQLTASSVYKKKDQARINDVTEENDPTAEYFSALT